MSETSNTKRPHEDEDEEPFSKNMRGDLCASSEDNQESFDYTGFGDEDDVPDEHDEHDEHDEYDEHDEEDDEDEEKNVADKASKAYKAIEDDEYDEDADDYDVEEHEHVIAGDPERIVKIRISVSTEFGDFDWLENIRGRCTLDGDIIGYITARFVTRDSITRYFWEEMEQPSQDMSNIAFELFDRYGCLKTKFKEHAVQKGSGRWGEELDNGPLLLIEDLSVENKTLRRHGLGRAMAKLVMEKAEAKAKLKLMSLQSATARGIWYLGRDTKKYSRLHTILQPGWLRADDEEEWRGQSRQRVHDIKTRAIDTAIAFFRSMGFRRIGGSSLLEFSHDSEHPSRGLASQDDFDLPKESLAFDDLDESEEEDDFLTPAAAKKESRKMQRLRETLPLHHAALTLQDTDCLEFFQARSDSTSDWARVDHLGKNVLHEVACQSLPLTTQWLALKLDISQELVAMRNREGFTPLEALQEKLELSRTRMSHGLMTLVISDRFKGFEETSVECLSFLVAASSDHKKLSEIDRLRLKYGCTCGECVGGFISPRMASALLYQAEVIYDSLNEDYGDDVMWLHEYVLEHVDEGLTRNFRTNKSLRQGFANVFNLIAAGLRSKTVPTRANILHQWEISSEWPPVTRNYSDRGNTMEGKIEPVLQNIFDFARDEDSRTGNGEFEATMSKNVEKLKTCRNDHEFGFVAVACGLEPGEGFY